jgi:hypothetical protein
MTMNQNSSSLCMIFHLIRTYHTTPNQQTRKKVRQLNKLKNTIHIIYAPYAYLNLN